jgi:hypothetical protein
MRVTLQKKRDLVFLVMAYLLLFVTEFDRVKFEFRSPSDLISVSTVRTAAP